MIEERIIRVEREDFDYLQEIHLSNLDLVGQEFFPSKRFRDELRNSFEKLELSPLKDWRPWCWMNESYETDKPCDNSVGDKESWCCIYCPYRKRDD
jgi:hypothetical protein